MILATLKTKNSPFKFVLIMMMYFILFLIFYRRGQIGVKMYMIIIASDKIRARDP